MSRRKAFETSLSGNSTPQAPSTSSGGSGASGGNANGSKGKGKANGNQSNANANAKAARAPPAINPPDPSVGSGTVPTETAAEKGKALAKAPSPLPLPDEGSGEESELCFICAEPVTFYSVGICGHRTCHVCAVRLRTFYKKSECTFCKTPLPSLLFSRSADTPFPEEHHKQPSPANVIAAAQENADKLPKGERWDRGLTLPGTLDLGSFAFTDDKLGVVFEDEAMMEETLLLLRFNCPYDGCAHMAHDWPSLEQHTLKVHGLVICSLCRRQLSRFAHEQVLYPPHLLPLHDPSRVLRGQRPPKPRGDEVDLVKGWEAPHPMCEFCHQAFFGPDELFKHMREKHEECFVCRQLGEKDVYFQNYAKLEQHFGAEHYPCTQPICLDKKFVVFPSEMDLRAHMMDEHSEAMSARDRANMRHLPVDFQEPRRRGGAAGGGRGASAGANDSGPSTMRRDGMPQQQQIGQAPPMAPAQAAQARRAAQVDRQEESRRRRGFDTGLTGGLAANTEGGSRRAQVAAAQTQGGRSGFATPREDVDDATAGRHAALLSRVALLVQGNDIKLSSFRSAVRQFKNNESSAKDMIDTIFNVLDRDVDSTIGVLREISGLFDDEDKSRSVLESINGFRVEQREQFPALATPTGLGSNYAGITSGAILNAKRSTQSHRRGSSSQNVWDRVEAAAANQPVNRPAATKGVNGRHVPGATSGGPAFGFATGSRAGLNASAFPSLGAGAPGSSKASGSTSSTPWAGGSGGGGGGNKAPSALTGVVRSTPSSGSAFPSIGSSGPSTKSKAGKPPSTAAFPSLPSSSAAQQARDERRALFAKPTPAQESMRRITGQAAAVAPPTGNGWGGAAGVGSGAKSPLGVGNMSDEMMALQIQQEEEAAAAQEGGKKKKGKGKQLLFQVSARPT